jgi:hypothetical protein
MANIHTPEGFKAYFLSNFTGGLDPNWNQDTYPRVNFPEFITEHAKRFKVRAVHTSTGEVFLIYSNNRTQNNKYIIDAFVDNFDKNDENTQRSFLALKAPDAINNFYNVNSPEYGTAKIVVITPSLSNDKTYLSKICAFGDKIYDIFNSGNTRAELTKFLSAAALNANAVDPFVATRILLGYEYPKDNGSHYFTGEGESHPGLVLDETRNTNEPMSNTQRSIRARLVTFIKNIFIPALTEAHKDVKDLLNNNPQLEFFIENIYTLVQVANRYEGGYYFDPAVLHGKNAKVKSYLPKNLIHKEITPLTAKNIENYTRQMEKIIEQEGGEARELLNEEYVENVGEQLGGGAYKYNKAPLYKKYIDMKLRLLKMKNKSLSQRSQDKIDTIIHEIAEREAYLRTIDESLTAYLHTANNKEEEINDFEGYKNLHVKKNNLRKSLNKAYINMADVVETIAKTMPVPL